MLICKCNLTHSGTVYALGEEFKGSEADVALLVKKGHVAVATKREEFDASEIAESKAGAVAKEATELKEAVAKSAKEAEEKDEAETKKPGRPKKSA